MESRRVGECRHRAVHHGARTIDAPPPPGQSEHGRQTTHAPARTREQNTLDEESLPSHFLNNITAGLNAPRATRGPEDPSLYMPRCPPIIIIIIIITMIPAVALFGHPAHAQLDRQLGRSSRPMTYSEVSILWDMTCSWPQALRTTTTRLWPASSAFSKASRSSAA